MKIATLVLLGGSGLENLLEAGSVKSHSIGTEYGIKAEQLMEFVEKPSFKIVVNDKPVEIKTEEFLRRILEVDIAALRGSEYKEDQKTFLEMDKRRGGIPGKDLNGNDVIFYRSNVADALLLPFIGMISNRLVPIYDYSKEINDFVLTERIKSEVQGKIIGLVDIEEKNVVYILADCVFPLKTKERRNDGTPFSIDLIEAIIFKDVVREVLKAYVIKEK